MIRPRQAVQALLGLAGYRLVRTGTPIRTYEECLGNLRRLGLQPGTVFDVGVADGTPGLQESFPEARLVLIEPLEEYRPRLDEICRGRNACYFIAAAGEQPGEIALRVGRDRRKSSMVRQVLKGDTAETRVVPVVTLDALCRELQLKPPYLLKIDAEGAEIRVLAGATATLPETAAAILEVTVCGGRNQSPELFEVLAYMKHAGFVVHDIIGAATHPATGGLQHVDLVFVQEDGPFRRTDAGRSAEGSRR
jgi:FkbM family methyltransferase